jgi:hypothetical protein
VRKQLEAVIEAAKLVGDDGNAAVNEIEANESRTNDEEDDKVT